MQEVSDKPSGEQDRFSSANQRSTHMPADQGDAQVQFLHGTSLEQDIEIPRGLALTTECYKLSADQGHARDQVRYGFCLDYGRGVEQDLRLAAHYFKLAADQGNAGGQVPNSVAG
jgi:TPR repeat protein